MKGALSKGLRHCGLEGLGSGMKVSLILDSL